MISILIYAKNYAAEVLANRNVDKCASIRELSNPFPIGSEQCKIYRETVKKHPMYRVKKSVQLKG